MEIRYDQLLALVFLFTRCSGIFIFTPFFGSLNVPVQVRIILAAGVSYLFSFRYHLPAPAAPWQLPADRCEVSNGVDILRVAGPPSVRRPAGSAGGLRA